MYFLLSLSSVLFSLFVFKVQRNLSLLLWTVIDGRPRFQVTCQCSQMDGSLQRSGWRRSAFQQMPQWLFHSNLWQHVTGEMELPNWYCISALVCGHWANFLISHTGAMTALFFYADAGCRFCLFVCLFVRSIYSCTDTPIGMLARDDQPIEFDGRKTFNWHALGTKPVIKLSEINRRCCSILSVDFGSAIDYSIFLYLLVCNRNCCAKCV